MIAYDVNLANINIQKPTVKSILFKKAKFMFVIEFDTMITCTETPRL
jgi:hypothetical protein